MVGGSGTMGRNNMVDNNSTSRGSDIINCNSAGSMARIDNCMIDDGDVEKGIYWIFLRLLEENGQR